MSTLPFEITLFVGKKEFSHSHSPSEESARKVAKWHCDRGPINSATILNVKTGALQAFHAELESVINEATGEVLDDCPGCIEAQIQIAGLARDIKSWAAKYAALYREKEEEAEDSPEWDDVRDLFYFWRRICKHPNAKLDLARYKNVLPFLKHDGKELCYRAIAGAAFDSFNKPNKAGRVVSYNDWEFIYRNRTNFEKECNRAPRDWKTIYQLEEQETAR